jgi:hypothetical protein
MRFLSPTPDYKVRSDGWGDGVFGAPRGGKFHDGLDLVVVPGWPITSPIDGVVEKYEQPYARDPMWKGIQIANKQIRVEIWYMLPKLDLVGSKVSAGDLVGQAQDISMKYGWDEKKKAMLPHIHLRVTALPFTMLVERQWNASKAYLDPKLFLEF